MSVFRFDSYVPCWARGIIDDLEAGTPGPEAVANAAASLRRQADEAEQRAACHERKARTLRLMGEQWIGTDVIADQHDCDAATHAERAADLREMATNVATLRGEFIPIARMLR